LDLICEVVPERSLALSLHNIYETLAVSWPTMLEALQGKVTKQLCDERLTAWSRNIVQNARIDLDVVGRERLDRGRTFLIMSNHQSLYDIPVLFDVIGANLRMITKKELFDVPVFGKALRAGGFIAIDRGDRASAIASLEIARRTLAQGTHVWIAPEGTRSKTGQLLPFKKGGFNLAIDANLPILPVTLRGTRDVLAAKGVRSRSAQRVTVTIHAPIDPAPYAGQGKEGRNRLIQDVRRALESAL
jgi:1-acyl-sn-glycerol-3-phosphate acyltransferase